MVKYEKQNYIMVNRYNFGYISGLLSSIICGFLFDEITINKNDYRYRVRCFDNSGFDSKDGYLQCVPLWSNTITMGDDVQRLQNFETHAGWYCGLCRLTLSYNDWCFHCGLYPSHDYCIQCTHAMIHEIIKFEKYLTKIIHKYVDKEFSVDCIQILTAFVIGHAKKRKT